MISVCVTSTIFPYTTLFRSIDFGDRCPARCYEPGTPEFVYWQSRESALAALATWETINGQYTNRSEEHTSELQSRRDLVCRLLREKKKQITQRYSTRQESHQ